MKTGAKQACWEHCVGAEEAEGWSGWGVGTMPPICEPSPGETEGGVGTGWPVERSSGVRDDCAEKEKDEEKESRPGRGMLTQWPGFSKDNWSRRQKTVVPIKCF